MAEYNSVNLGRIMPKYTGDYSTNANYNTLDIVFYEGSSYIATQPSLRQTPSIDSEYWGLISSKGDKGDKGDTGAQGPKGDKGDKGDTPDLSNYVTLTDLNNGLSTKVTDNKNGKISVNGTSIIPANENVIGRIDGAYKDMNDIPNGWMYLNGWADVSKLANWGLPNDLYLVHCFKADYSISTTIQIAYGLNNYVYTRTRHDTSWSTWKLLADDASVVHNTGNENVAGNKTYVGDSTYMGTNTFMDGVSLNGKNVVNDVTDTDWQSLSLNAGYGGSIKYRYHMGALYLGIDDLTGIQVGMDKAPGRIPNYTTSKYHRFPLIIAGKGSITGTVSPNGTIYVGNANGITLTDSDKGFATVTVL